MVDINLYLQSDTFDFGKQELLSVTNLVCIHRIGSIVLPFMMAEATAKTYTVSSHIYTQSVSSEIRMKVGWALLQDMFYVE